MRISHITVVGETGREAYITGNGATIEVSFGDPEMEARSVSASDPMAVWRLARDMQKMLDGYTGTGTDVRSYLSALQYFEA